MFSSVHILNKLETIKDQYLNYVYRRNSEPSHGMLFLSFIPITDPEAVFENETITAFVWICTGNWGNSEWVQYFLYFELVLQNQG